MDDLAPDRLSPIRLGTSERARVQTCLAHAGVAVAWLFGSRARGEVTARSDTDVAVLARVDRGPLSLLELSRLAGWLEDLLPPPVEVIAFELATIELRARVVIGGRTLVSLDEPLRVRTIVDVQSRWEDVRPALREMDEGYLAAVAAR